MHRRRTRHHLLSLLTREDRFCTELALTREWQAQAETLASRCQRLADTVGDLCRFPRPETVREAQLSWESARLPWERIEGFLVGALQEASWGDRMDAWPILPEEVEAQRRDHGAHQRLASTTGGPLSDGPSGFHVLEILLYSVDGNRPASPERVARQLLREADRLHFLRAMAGKLRDDSERLRQSGLPPWETGSGKACAPGRFLEHWADLLEEACFAKVLLPVQYKDPNLLESRWSGSTRRDVEANLEGIARGGRLLVPAIVGPHGTHLLDRWEAGMDHCLHRVRSLPELTETTLAAARPAAESVFAAGRALRQLVTEELLPRTRGNL